MKFELLHVDRSCGARRGRLITSRGTVELPAFMPVGTQGTVKGLTPVMIAETGAEMVLANTYHLFLRPGDEVVAALGGLHTMMGWPGPMLTDSGGFQIFSLAALRRVDERGAVFKSQVDGSLVELSPERAMEIQGRLGSDIAMVLDHVVPLPASESLVAEACQRTVRWAERSRRAARGDGQAVFGIAQGGLSESWRRWCCRQLAELDFPGYAIGGLSVGEAASEMDAAVAVCCAELPADRPRYLMGVGRPQDLLVAIAHGVDLFDCVMPTRNGRNALAFTDGGPLRLRNAMHARDPQPLQAELSSPYAHLSRGYLRHLFLAGEMLGPILVSFHNLRYYQRLMEEARQAIEADAYREFLLRKFAGWGDPLASAGRQLPGA